MSFNNSDGNFSTTLKRDMGAYDKLSPSVRAALRGMIFNVAAECLLGKSETVALRLLEKLRKEFEIESERRGGES
jgi:hypothetical protein